MLHEGWKHAAERFVEDVALGPGAWGLLPPEERETFIRHAATFAEENADPSICGIELESLAGVTMPVLLTEGGTSPPLFPPILERLASTLPRVERRRFPKAGHIPHATHPNEYEKAVADFTSRTGPETTERRRLRNSVLGDGDR